MTNELKINGMQNFMGTDIPIVEGGFGENCRVVTDKTISEIHQMRIGHIRENINNNIKRFKENIDFIDLKKVIGNTDNNLLFDIGYTKMQISKSECVYLLSERGYAKLIKIMDSDKAWEVHDRLIDEYFSMRKELNPIKQQKAMLLLAIYAGGKDAVIASKELSKIEIEESTAPLIAENTRKQEVINGLTDKIPLYKKPDIINRICTKSQGGYANRYKELYKCFRENFHADLIKQSENYNEKQLKKKDRLSIIRYAEKFGYIDDLYTCCVKLYESEVREILKELDELHK